MEMHANPYNSKPHAIKEYMDKVISISYKTYVLEFQNYSSSPPVDPQKLGLSLF
jgi:hypothetical protein